MAVFQWPVLGQVTEIYRQGFRWDPPTEGSPPVRYMVLVQRNETGPVDTLRVDINEISTDFLYGNTYTIQVAGVDAKDRVGVFSNWSVPVYRDYPQPDFSTTGPHD